MLVIEFGHFTFPRTVSPDVLLLAVCLAFLDDTSRERSQFIYTNPTPQNTFAEILMDPKLEHAGLEEVEKLTSDDSYLKPDTGGIHNELRASNTDTTGQSSATSGGPEKREDVEIVDWNGPDDPENPYERLPTACSRTTNNKTDNRLSFNWSPSRKWILTLTTCFM